MGVFWFTLMAVYMGFLLGIAFMTVVSIISSEKEPIDEELNLH